MPAKRKISVRKILQMLVTLIVTVCCITAIISASKIEDNKKVKSIAVHIKNDKKYHFIEQQEILDLAVTRQQIDLGHTPISKLDIRAMEQVIMADPWVANAQVYIDNENVLQLYVTQRIPVARIFDQSNRSYYLDTTLSIMPLSSNYVYYTTLVTNMPDVNNDSMGWALRKDILTLVKKIQNTPFWNAQISQIIVDSPGMYELVPLLGDQRIILGDLSRLTEKLDNLFIFYKNVLNRIGWDKYETLDLRFSGQVVASPSLPYKGPADKAIVTMNWINSILETEARNDALNEVKDSVKAVAAKTTLIRKEKEKLVIKPAKKPLKKVKYVMPDKSGKQTNKNGKKTPDKPAKPSAGNKGNNSVDKNKRQADDKKNNH
jgi:cell division protein FtsQ